MLRRGIGLLDRWAAPARAGALLACLIYAALLFVNAIPLEVDAHSYWAADPLQPYVRTPLGIYSQDAYFYSPAFTQLIGPLHALPWPIFAGLWALLMTGCLLFVAGHWFGWALIVPVVAIELAMGNVHLLMAAAMVAGFRYPGLWSLMVLTKITPGVGVLWFAVRREWRKLAVALGTTAALAGISILIAPGLWREWAEMLLGLNGRPVVPSTPFDFVPRPIRFVLAAWIVVWGARSDRRWAVPIAVTLAMPVVYINSLAMLVATPPLWLRDRNARDATSSGRDAESAVSYPSRDVDVVPAT
jgi:hypothetical protein